MAIDLLKYMIWKNGTGGGGKSYEKTVGPAPIISIADAKAKPAKSLIVGMEPIQAGSGDPSPDNIRPISGRTGVTVERTGKNLFNLSEYAKANWSKVSDAEYPDTYTGYKHEFYHLYGDPSSNPDAKGLLGRRMPLGQVTISFYKYLSNNDAVYFHYVGDGNWTNHSGAFSTVGYVSFTSNANKICDGVAFDTIQGSTSKARFGALQIEIAAERTNYESYTGHTYPVTWQTAAGTVYGGTVDLVSGVLTVTWARTLISSNWGWHRSTSYLGGFYSTQSTTLGYKLSSPFLCSHAKTATSLSEYVEGTCYCDGSLNFRLMPTDGSATVDDWKAYIDAQEQAGTPIEICYELKTPVPFTLSPTQIQLLKGANVLWSDGDDLTLTYIGTEPPNLLGGMLGNPQEPVSEEPEVEPVSEEPEE